tara:strand:+ start:8372 stop:9265 length:894 start_codon:yes stop_codon:yes gene_type:complete
VLKNAISIIVPTFNRANTIERCLNSVIEQDYPKYKMEIVVVDDGSHDETPRILRNYQHQHNIRVLQQPNNGVSAARNLGLKYSKYDWIAFLDSDDYWTPKKLRHQMNLLRKEQRLVCHTQEIWIRNGKRINQHKHHAKFGGNIFEKNLPLCAMSPSSIIIHRSVFEAVGTFDEQLPACEDYDLWIRITSKFTVSFVDTACLYKTGGHPDQLSQKYPAMDRFRIYALLKLINSNNLDDIQFTQAKSMLRQKAKIYLKGCLKHSRPMGRLIEELGNILMDPDWSDFIKNLKLNNHLSSE